MSLRDPPPKKKTNARNRIGTHIESVISASGELIRRDESLAGLDIFFIEKLGYEVSFRAVAGGIHASRFIRSGRETAAAPSGKHSKGSAARKSKRLHYSN